MSHILITGSNGQLGNELRVLSKEYRNDHFIFTDLDELDIADKQAVDAFFAANQIDFVVNCAAYTAVDKAETDEDIAFLLNATAVSYLVEACTTHQIKLIHISTDYVFDGCGCVPYREENNTNPLSAYGRTKLAGEQAASKCPQSVIIRTSWLYSSFGNNFVKTMIRLGKERNSLNVVFDQIGTPTYAADLAQTILSIIQYASTKPLQTGIFHYSNEGVCSWYDFAHEIMQLCGLSCQVNPIEAKDYPAPAPRPHYSVLNKTKIKASYGIKIPHWRDSLKRCLKELSELKNS